MLDHLANAEHDVRPASLSDKRGGGEVAVLLAIPQDLDGRRLAGVFGRRGFAQRSLDDFQQHSVAPPCPGLDPEPSAVEVLGLVDKERDLVSSARLRRAAVLDNIILEGDAQN